jgi:hypothetical protein
MPNQYHPQVSLGTAGIQTAEPSWVGCTIPNLRDNVQFVPITASVVTAPSITHWGATVNVGPKTPLLVPSPTGYKYFAEEKPDSPYQPWQAEDMPMDDYGTLEGGTPARVVTNHTSKTGAGDLVTTDTA